MSAWAPLWQHLSRGYFSRGLREEINSGNANTSNWLQGGGIGQFDKLHAEFWEPPENFDRELSEKARRSLDNRFDTGLRPMWDNYTRRHTTWLDVDDEPCVPYRSTERSARADATEDSHLYPTHRFCQG